MSEWNIFKLDNIADIIDSMHITPKYTNFGVPLVRVTDLKNGYLDLSECLKVSEDTYDIYSKNHKSQIGDIVFARVGSYGNLAITNKLMKYCLGQNTTFIVPKQNPYYLYYYLKSPQGKNEIEGSVSGSTQPTISLNSIKNFDIKLPSLPEQKAIASVLSSLDDKIDLLHRQNKTLELMAETLFRQWFIEEAQDDWIEEKITNLFEVRDGTHDSPKQAFHGYPLVTSKHIGNGVIDINNTYLISETDHLLINKRSKVEQFDILFSMIGTIGRTYIEFSDKINYSIKNIGLFKTSQNTEWLYFTYLWLTSSMGRDFIHETKSGSTQEYISLGSLRSITFKFPNKEVLEKFNKIVDDLFRKIYKNQEKIRVLEKLRDTLLPKLMSGEVRVRYTKE